MTKKIGQLSLFFLELHTWENLAEKVHFLLEVSMRELLMGWLHKVLAGVEEILEQEQGKTTTTDQCYNDREHMHQLSLTAESS